MIQYPTPLEARLRNFTYETELFLDIEYKIFKQMEGQEAELIHSEIQEKIPIGKMPVMVKSKYCALNNLSEAEIVAKGECPYD